MQRKKGFPRWNRVNLEKKKTKMGLPANDVACKTPVSLVLKMGEKVERKGKETEDTRAAISVPCNLRASPEFTRLKRKKKKIGLNLEDNPTSDGGKKKDEDPKSTTGLPRRWQKTPCKGSVTRDQGQKKEDLQALGRVNLTRSIQGAELVFVGGWGKGLGKVD